MPLTFGRKAGEKLVLRNCSIFASIQVIAIGTAWVQLMIECGGFRRVTLSPCGTANLPDLHPRASVRIESIRGSLARLTIDVPGFVTVQRGEEARVS